MEQKWVLFLFSIMLVSGLVGIAWVLLLIQRSRKQGQRPSAKIRLFLICSIELTVVATLWFTFNFTQSIVLFLYILLFIGLFLFLAVHLQQRSITPPLRPFRGSSLLILFQGVVFIALSLTYLLLENWWVKQVILQMNLPFLVAYAGSFFIILVILAFMHNGLSLLWWFRSSEREERQNSRDGK